MRLPDVERRTADLLHHIDLYPWSTHQAREPEVEFRQADGLEQPRSRAKDSVGKRLPVRVSDIEAFGHTVGCPRCDHALKY